MAESLVIDAKEGKGLPIWPVANDESTVMVEDPSDLIIANTYAFGAQDFDTKGALATMLHGADNPDTHIRLYAERPGLRDYLKRGYIPEGPLTTGSASITLEDANADFAISQFCRALGQSGCADRFLARSANWRKLFNPNTKYIRARDQSGVFLSGFSPDKTTGFVEGNAAQYTWMVPYDLPAVIQSLGGPDAANARLDDYFSKYGEWTGSGYTPHFFISNEPSFGNPWIYNWTGHPWQTQKVVRKTRDELFTDTAGGLPGNDDLGATSAWVVFGYLGIYPAIPGVGGFTLSTPIFPTVNLSLGEHDLLISADVAPNRTYIESVWLDGVAISNWWVGWEQLKRAKELHYGLRDEPNSDSGERPPSFPPQPR
ncbi:Alpha-1,2-mannosidase [Acidisarcina polymorpha]|uniref:Alpha-1,2-mannosidase n=1 Tax=Acidisarcina polymorpha TaxID=2211140 RepID=A0A2Z5G515_9BACT|nr:Alpha-1,2-mannosidase [Acidisarcina polymorpha]